MGKIVTKQWLSRIVELSNAGTHPNSIAEALHKEGYRGSGHRMGMGTIYAALGRGKGRTQAKRTYKKRASRQVEVFSDRSSDKIKALEIVMTSPNMPNDERLFLAKIVLKGS